jgi:hypothetical protein
MNAEQFVRMNAAEFVLVNDKAVDLPIDSTAFTAFIDRLQRHLLIDINGIY